MNVNIDSVDFAELQALFGAYVFAAAERLSKCPYTTYFFCALVTRPEASWLNPFSITWGVVASAHLAPEAIQLAKSIHSPLSF